MTHMDDEMVPLEWQGEFVEFDPVYIRGSTESVDGAEVTVELLSLPEETNRVWLGSTFRMPSGRYYIVDEIRWEPSDEWYVAHIRGSRSDDESDPA